MVPIEWQGTTSRAVAVTCRPTDDTQGSSRAQREDCRSRDKHVLKPVFSAERCEKLKWGPASRLSVNRSLLECSPRCPRASSRALFHWDMFSLRQS